jgi:DNA repair exonuclease SbcCD ATPase subunit/predicted MPP superfamily phosphohydrolase
MDRDLEFVSRTFKKLNQVPQNNAKPQINNKKYIFHISDIHIKMSNRVNLQSSFIKLIADMTAKPNSLLVIAGDIFENKTHVTQDELYLFYWMLEGLASKNITTVMIPGNHDYNTNSVYEKNNLAVLTLKYPNVKCFSTTNRYTVDDIDFYVYSPIDGKIPEYDPDSDKFRVAILHEMVDNAVFDNGERISGARFGISEFSKYDITLLGDIHKPQFLTANVAYSGSFVQKTKGEGLDHGYILWDLEKRRGEHHFIKLKEVFLKVEAKNDACKIPELQPTQVVKYLSLYHQNCTDEYLKSLRKQLIKQFGDVNKIVNRNLYEESNIRLEPVQPTVFDQIELIKKILDGEQPDTVAKICEMHNKRIQNRKDIHFANYKFNYLRWDNIYCYGENNYIDFRTFHNQIVLLNGKNKHGKSTIIDIILRILFNDTERGYKEDVVNKRCKEGSIKISFNIGSDEYVVFQKIRKSGSSSLHRLYKNGANITKHSITETYKYITKDLGLGDYKDFLNLTTALQNRKFLIDLSKKDLLALMTKILNVDVLYDIEKDVAGELSLVKKLNKKAEQDYERAEAKFDASKYDAAKTKLQELTKHVTACERQVKDMYEELTELNRTYVNEHVPEDIDELVDKQKKLLETMPTDDTLTQQEIQEEIILLGSGVKLIDTIDKVDTKKLNEYRKYIKMLESKCVKPKQDMLEQYILKPTIHALQLEQLKISEQIQEYISFITKVHNADKSNIDIKKLLEDQKQLLKSLKPTSTKDICLDFDTKTYQSGLNMQVPDIDLVFDEHCECCQKNKSVADKKFGDVFSDQKRTEIIMAKELVERVHNRYNECVAALIDSRKLAQEYANCEQYYNMTKAKAIYNDLANKRYTYLYHLNAFHDAKKELVRLQRLQSIGLENNKLGKKITKRKKSIDQISQNMHTAIREKEELSNLLSVYRCHKETLKSLAKDRADYNSQIIMLEKYLKCINGKTGIPSYILKAIISTLNNRCNEILHKIADFEVLFEFDRELKLYTIENGTKIPAVMGSGFQKFLLDMIMRIILTDISVLSCPNIIFIDEGFGCLDADNFTEVAKILRKLKYNFDAMIIITHIQELKSYADVAINIDRNENFSNIKFGKLTEAEANVNIDTTSDTLPDDSEEVKTEDNEPLIDANEFIKTPVDTSNTTNVAKTDTKKDKVKDETDNKKNNDTKKNNDVKKNKDKKESTDKKFTEADIMHFFDITSDGVYCKACQKSLKLKTRPQQVRHLNSQAAIKKHGKFVE